MEDDEIQIIDASEISFCLDDIELSSLKPQREVNESTAMTTVSTLNSSFFDQIDLAKLNRQEKIVKDFTGNKKKVRSSLRALRQLAMEDVASCKKLNVISL